MPIVHRLKNASICAAARLIEAPIAAGSEPNILSAP